MRIFVRLICTALLGLGAVAMEAAAIPAANVASKQTGRPVSDRELVRSQLLSYFNEIAKNSPTVLGGLSKSPETLKAIQERIAVMSDDELARFQKLMADTPDWKVAPEAFASAFPPEVLEHVRRVGADYAKQIPEGETMRGNVRTLAGILKLLPDSKLAELGVDRKMVASLEATFSEMSPIESAMLQKRVSEISPWREKSATAMHSLPPALQRGAAALNEHGPLSEKDIVELNKFRGELMGLLSRIEKMPADAKSRLKNLDVAGINAQLVQLSKAPPDVLFMVRHNMPQEMLQGLKQNVAFLEKVSNFDEKEKAELDLFRKELAVAFRQLKGEGGADWAEADDLLSKLAPEHLYLLKQRMASLGVWQTALPAIYQTLSAPETAARLQAVRGASPEPAAVQALEVFRRQALDYIDAVKSTPGLDPAFVAKARNTIERAPLDRLELIRMGVERLPETATAAERLSVVAMHDIDFGCSLSMTVVPEVCVPEICVPEICVLDICTPSFCTPAGCTPAVTVNVSFDVICNPLEDALEAVEHSIVGTANAAVETMRAGIQTAINNVEATVNASIASVNQIVSTSVSAITSTVNSISAFVQTIPDLAWSAIKSALNLLLGIELRNGVTLRDLVGRGTEHALTSMKTLLGLASGWWTAVSTFTLPQIPCPPAGFHTPFGTVGDGAAASNYARYRLMIDGIVSMIPDTETSLAIKVPAQVTYMLFDFLGICLDQAAADADSAEGTSRHNLVLTNFGNMQTFVSAQISGLQSSSAGQTTSLLNLLTTGGNASRIAMTAQSQAIQSLINAQSTSTQTLVSSEGSETRLLLTNTTDSTQSDIQKFKDLDLRVTIERVLQAGVSDEIATLQLLEPLGHLRLVSRIVQESIQSMTVAQEGVGQAQRYFDAAVELMNAGKAKAAFREFIKAYRETTK